jgi:peptidyl-prolyl cis-trans isomerase C
VIARTLCIGALALAFSAQFAEAAPVARVNGTDITEAELAFAEAEVGAEIAGLPAESRRRVLVEYLVEAHLFADEAGKSKLGAGKDFEERVAYYRLRALRDTFYEKKVREAVTEGQAKAAYEEQTGKLKPEPEVRARHILVKTEQDAKDLIGQLQGGADFTELAKKSADGPSAATGGDLGYFSRGQMVKTFEDAAFALEPGQISAPIQSDYGWHVIKLEDKRNRPVPSFDEVKDQILASLIQTQLRDVVGKLRGSAKVEIVDAELKKSMEEDAKAGEEDRSRAPEDRGQASGKDDALAPGYVSLPDDIRCAVQELQFSGTSKTTGRIEGSQLGDMNGSVAGVKCGKAGGSKVKDIPLAATALTGGMLPTKDFGNVQIIMVMSLKNGSRIDVAIGKDKLQSFREYVQK